MSCVLAIAESKSKAKICFRPNPRMALAAIRSKAISLLVVVEVGPFVPCVVMISYRPF